ncbi:glycosylated lysosomal membrane protein [Stigmatopora nigra]
MAAARIGGSALLLFAILPALCAAFSRKLSVELNPGSSSRPPGGDLLHIRALGDNDTLHFLFCSQGAPTLLLVHTNLTSSYVKVNWTLFLSSNTSGGLRVEPETSVIGGVAVVFTRLLEYLEVNDTVETFSPYRLDEVTWSPMVLSGPAARLCGALAGGSVCLNFTAFESEGRALPWPRLLHTANSSQLALQLDGLAARSANSRFLLELRTLSGTSPLDAVRIRRSIDDEFTPSIFKSSEWTSNSNESQADERGFISWKQVAYRRAAPMPEDAVPCRHSEPQAGSGQTLAELSALVRAFFREDLRDFGLNLSFGLTVGPSYNDTAFLSWTATVGLGRPPVDAFSPLVVAVLAAGLGAPLLMLLMGGVYVAVRKRSAVPAGYQPIN